MWGGVGNDVHVATLARRKQPGSCRVEMRVQMADSDGAVLSGTDLNEAIALYTAVSWHSSYPWTTTQPTRRFGGSMVIIYDGEGNSVVGLLQAAVDIARKWGLGQRYLGMIQRLEHEMNRPEDYDYRLALCRSAIPRSEASDLLVQSLWKMWGITLQECSQSVHKRNTSFIRKELRGRGITLHPDSDPVVRLPAGSLWSVIDVKRVRPCWFLTFHFVCATSFWRSLVLLGWNPPLWAVHVLDNGRSWTRRVNDVENIL